MKIVAWRSGRVASSWHISHLGQPLCGTPIPDAVQWFSCIHARPAHWAQVCLKCREAARQQAAPGVAPTEVPR